LKIQDAFRHVYALGNEGFEVTGKTSIDTNLTKKKEGGGQMILGIGSSTLDWY